MRWNRHRSRLEELVVEVLVESKDPLTIREIIEVIEKRNPNIFSGLTPNRSLYSIIFRREKRRQQLGIEPLIVPVNRDRPQKYTVNRRNIRKAGIKITSNE